MVASAPTPSPTSPAPRAAPAERAQPLLAEGRERGRWQASRTALEVKASAISLGNKGRDDLALGQRVFHGKFGYGTIAAIEGNKLEIDFEHAGRKRVLDSFVSAG